MSDTELIASVDAAQLQSAYRRCRELFDETDAEGRLRASAILTELQKVSENLSPGDVLDLFRRVCLMVQLVSELDAKWPACDGYASPPEIFPMSLFIMVSEETAFETSQGKHASVFFARDLLDDALAILRPN